ncbi:MAG: hypothetical protein KKB13_04240 [Chloroflexi bacterium]|nr:hypothetical protein [Chloroflexota bacterium]
MTEESSAETRSSSKHRSSWVRRVMSGRPHLFPPAFHDHARAARKEALLAMRSVIDARIERLERHESPAKAKTHRVKVE